MIILNQDLLSAAAAVLYLAMGARFWRTRWSTKGTEIVSPMLIWERAAIGFAGGLHALALYSALFAHGGMQFSFSLALSLMLWLAVVIYWLESFHARLEGMQPMVLCLAAAGALSPLLFPKAHSLQHAQNMGFRLHFLAAMSAYSLFTVSALHVIFMGFAERRLHRRTISRVLASLPPLLTMEALLFRMVAIAFALLTLALASGIFFSEAIYGKPLGFDHKTLFAFVSWSIFAALLTGRRFYGWRGKTAQRWLLSGFGTLLLAYVGSRFVVEVILGR